MFFDLDEAKKNKTPQDKTVEIAYFSTFEDTFKKYKSNNAVVAAFKEFIKSKVEDPLKPFGSKDYGFNSGNAFSGYKHAGLTNDVSIFYTLTGNSPKQLKLYAIWSHDDAGIGQPSNRRKQVSNAARLDQAKQVSINH